MGILSGFRKMAGICFKTAGLSLALVIAANAAPNARFAVGPDSNYLLLVDSLKGAKSSIWINIYEFSQAPIAALMIDKIREGIEVKILIETQPCCNNKMTDDAKKIVRSLHNEMKKPGANPNNQIFLMGANVNPVPVETPPENPNGGANPEATPAPSPGTTAAKRRFRYNHAKYAIIDNSRVMMSSENLTEKGHPLPGTIGNRGYTADFMDAGLVQKVTQTFLEDSDTKNSDVLGVGPRDILPLWMGDSGDILQNEPEHWTTLQRSFSETTSETENKRKNKTFLASLGTASKIDYFYSPKALPGLEDFIDRAKSSLKLQFMSMPSTWNASGRTIVNPIVAHAIRAASNGVRVRFLLNDERTFDSKPNPTTAKGNEITVAYLDKIAECYELPIMAKIIDVKATGISYIHNKGMVSDSNRVLISSINGTMNSVENNRETAVSVESSDLGAYYNAVHDYDWNKTTRAFSDDRVKIARDKFQSCPTLPLASEDGSTDPIFRTPGFGIVKFY